MLNITHFRHIQLYSFVLKPIKPLYTFFALCMSTHTKIRQNIIKIVLISWWKNKYKCRYIGCWWQIQSAVADTSCKEIFIKSNFALIPFFHRHPADSLLHPLIQTKLPESIFFTGSFLCRVTRSNDLIHTDSFIKTRISLFPDLRRSPVLGFIRTVNDRIKGRIVLSALKE